MAKKRIKIPPDAAAMLQFRSDRTCCVCNERGRPTQIHHIDGDSSNYAPDNLALLCVCCHDETQIKGGFGRKLNELLVIKYRDKWFERVQKRRDAADKVTSAYQVASPVQPPTGITRKETSSDPTKAINFIRILPAIRRDVYGRARLLWNTGVTSKMRNGSYDAIDVFERLLVILAAWYPPHHFDGKDPQDYMNEITASRFKWHWAHLEPLGSGSGGTIIGVIVGGCVLADLENMLVDMVSSLVMYFNDFDQAAWKQEWKAANPSLNVRTNAAYGGNR